MKLPEMIRVRQIAEAPVVKNISEEIRRQFGQLALPKRLKKGSEVAVACSSRGIANYDLIVRETVNCLRGAGFDPFLFPAMGSHGAATAEGQKKVLENYGLTQKTTGVPIRSSLNTIRIGTIEKDIPILIDSMACQADQIVLINRIKSHTEFEHEFESGLLKMMTIGLGKKEGASIYHKAFMIYGYPRIILSAAKQILDTGKIMFGVGIVENGYAQTAKISVVPADEIINQEKKLLRFAKQLSPRLPFESVDLLIIDEMGKDISGSGFDTKVVGRILMPLIAKEPESPKVKRILVCDLTEKTAGNADGVGIADFVTRRLVDKIDFQALYVNALTGGEPEHAKIPLTMETDREAIEAAIDSVGLIALDSLKIIRIKNTLELNEVEVSVTYKDQISDGRDLEIISGPHPMHFNAEGNLTPF